ncbi:glycosyltransferase family 2 protein [Paenibacillus faecis]|uniref:glycosyltransferase family 2 protein n=1 Tax=Paenibacillus faecis TaxID=862114 RepID=UPI001BCF5832|nr:glycosyltransferase family 2 protein [Paenibacillus faecis]
MDIPNFLILLSTYNGEKYLAEQINSLLSQKGVNLHILIRDDGSRDTTLSVIQTYMNRYPQIIRCLEGQNVGAKCSFFELIEFAAGLHEHYDYFAFCDQDDVWKENKLSRAAELLSKEDPNKPLMYCSSTQMVDSDLHALNVWPRSPRKALTVYNALVENVAVGCTTVLNGKGLETLTSSLPCHRNQVIMHDWWAYLGISTLGRVIFDSEPFILYRQHSSNVLGGQTDNWITKWRKRFKRYFKGQNHYILSTQAKEFLACFKSELDHETLRDIEDFIKGTSGNLLRRVSYALRTPFYRQSRADHGILKLIIILGKV